MGHWYAALKENTKLARDGTDKTDRTSEKGVLSVLSVHDLGKSENISNSHTIKPENRKSAEVIILDAVRAGNWSYGTVSRASRLGITRGYQEIEKLRNKGKIQQGHDGKLTVVEAKSDDA